MANSTAEFLDSTGLVGDPAALKARAEEDGYVFIRGLMRQDPLMRLRTDTTRILLEAGWLDAGTDPLDAISTQPARYMGKPDFTPIYDTLQRLESFHTMAHEPGLLEVGAALLGEPCMPQPSTIIRVFFPTANAEATRPHQDFVLVQGTPEVWTCWLPLGALPREMGGLAVLRGSHQRGVLPVYDPVGDGSLSITEQALEGQWCSSPFESGDALFFHSKTAHQGLPNVSGNRLRLSVDYRYQKKSDLIMEKNLGVHQGRITWEEVYAGWESKKYQYYWRTHQRPTTPKVSAHEFK